MAAAFQLDKPGQVLNTQQLQFWGAQAWIAKSILEYAGTIDVDEFIERLKIFNELAQPYDFKTKKQCLATRLRGSALQYFDSIRDMETVYD
ncbi:hypothetical protein QYM36_005708, partial [Artemia franciscana]